MKAIRFLNKGNKSFVRVTIGAMPNIPNNITHNGDNRNSQGQAIVCFGALGKAATPAVIPPITDVTSVQILCSLGNHGTTWQPPLSRHISTEFKAFKKDIEIKQEEISKSIAAQDAERIAKESAHNQHMKLLDNTMTEKKDESEVYEALAKKAQTDYISIQSKILSTERRLEKAQQDSAGIVKRHKESIAKIKEQYNNWKLNELDKVARLHLKGKIENIDKAGLREILGE